MDIKTERERSQLRLPSCISLTNIQSQSFSKKEKARYLIKTPRAVNKITCMCLKGKVYLTGNTSVFFFYLSKKFKCRTFTYVCDAEYFCKSCSFSLNWLLSFFFLNEYYFGNMTVKQYVSILYGSFSNFLFYIIINWMMSREDVWNLLSLFHRLLMFYRQNNQQIHQ